MNSPCIRAADKASAAINERPVIASEARQSMASGLHGLPRRCAPRNDVVEKASVLFAGK